jgi:hypothetical protein
MHKPEMSLSDSDERFESESEEPQGLEIIEGNEHYMADFWSNDDTQVSKHQRDPSNKAIQKIKNRKRNKLAKKSRRKNRN